MERENPTVAEAADALIEPTAGTARDLDTEGKRGEPRQQHPVPTNKRGAIPGERPRHALRQHYNVNIQSIDWVTQDEEDIDIDPGSRGFRLRRVPAGQDVDRMLVEGELGGLMYPEIPPSFRHGDPRIVRLWPDAKAEEQRFFQMTKIFPIMHTVVVHERLLEEHPWLAMNVVQAFRRSKDLAWKKMEDPRRVSLAWFREALEEQRTVLGRDPWPYDLASNLVALEAICRYAYEQALTRTALDPVGLFFPASLDDPPQYVGA